MRIISLALLLMLGLIVSPNNAFARTTPEDIVQERRNTYNAAIQDYSPASKQKLEQFEKRLADYNHQITFQWESNMLTQGLILEEYVRRQEIIEPTITDGINRNLQDPIENARYWITYAHEAVAFQAAKVYIFNSSTEGRIDQDITSTINLLQSDLNSLRNKVIKSQKIIQELVKS